MTTQKSVLITGSTSGVGLAGAEALARKGWKVFVHGRSVEKVARALETLRQRVPGGTFEGVTADLGSLASVVGLAEQVKAKTQQLDALWNNAGATQRAYKASVDGIELQMEVNYLAPFLLTRLLLPLVKASPQGRIVITSSMAHAFSPRGVKDWLTVDSKRYRSMAVYGQSKLATILFTQEMARRLEGTPVTVNAFHPGFVRSGFGATGDDGKKKGTPAIASFLAITPEKGADTGVFLVDDPSASKSTGGYWVKRRMKAPSREVTAEAAARLWDQSVTATKKFLGSVD